LKRLDEALVSYDTAIKINPRFTEAYYNRGNVLKELNRLDESLISYDTAIKINPNYAEAHANRGNVLKELKRIDEALISYDNSINIRPNFAAALSNRGITLQELNILDAALNSYDKAIIINPNFAEAHANRGNVLRELRRLDEALISYSKALTLNPDIDWVHGELLHTRMRISNWFGLTEAIKDISKKIIESKKVIQPLSLFALCDDALLQKKCAEIYSKNKYSINFDLGFLPKYAKTEKIRLAYFSQDFQTHPVSFLTSELFEIHDRNKFEVFAFSLRKADDLDEINLHLRKIFDRFIDAENMSDLEIAQLTRNLKIDIAIDLSGPTRYSRTGIFSYRAAPIQVNWLGFPGTFGANFIDYIVADRITIPEPYQKFYTEKVVYLPDTFMVDDSKRICSPRKFTRMESGLPENSFVYCCFNNDYKYNLQTIESWSRILLNVENSVLWLSENNAFFRENISTEFKKLDIDPGRIIFAKRLKSMSDHLSRYCLADLFLDTNPYNAHTTAIDSLKGGVPVLTLIGQSFASRVAASLLYAIGLPELITDTPEKYESLAIELAKDPKKLQEIKQNLAKGLIDAPLFNTTLFTKNLESAYIKMYENYQDGLLPKNITC